MALFTMSDKELSRDPFGTVCTDQGFGTIALTASLDHNTLLFDVNLLHCFILLDGHPAQARLLRQVGIQLRAVEYDQLWDTAHVDRAPPINKTDILYPFLGNRQRQLKTKPPEGLYSKAS